MTHSITVNIENRSGVILQRNDLKFFNGYEIGREFIASQIFPGNQTSFDIKCKDGSADGYLSYRIGDSFFDMFWNLNSDIPHKKSNSYWSESTDELTFHSCPSIKNYKTLSTETREMTFIVGDALEIDDC